MSGKNTSSRIQLKHDTEKNWNKAINFIPLAGEIIIYDADENNSKPRIKVGDGQTKLSTLEFIYDNLERIINGGTW